MGYFCNIKNATLTSPGLLGVQESPGMAATWHPGGRELVSGDLVMEIWRLTTAANE